MSDNTDWSHTRSKISSTSPFILLIPIILVIVLIIAFLFSFYRDAVEREIGNYKKLQMQELDLATNAFGGTLLSYIDKIYAGVREECCRDLEEGENISSLDQVTFPHLVHFRLNNVVFLAGGGGEIIDFYNPQARSKATVAEANYIRRDKAVDALEWWWSNYKESIRSNIRGNTLTVPPFYLNPYDQFLGVFYPLPDNPGDEMRYLVYLFDLAPYIDEYVDPIRMGETGSIYILDQTGRVVWDVEEKIIGDNVFDLHEDFPVLLDVDRRMLEEKGGTESYSFYRKRGEEVVEKEVAWKSLPFKERNLIFAHAVPRGELTSSLSLLRKRFFTVSLILTAIFILFVFLFFHIRSRRQQDIEQLLRSEVSNRTKELESAVEEKATLLKEIHHRVKNNLQIIASLLNLQALSTTDPNAQKSLEESKHRISSMALIHENIYKTENFSSVELNRYLNELVTQRIYSYGVQKIKPKIRIPVVNISLDVAIPLGIIINELITNCIKHAFPSGGGEIRVDLSRKGDYYRLSVQDNGKGLPADIEPEVQSSLGLSLIRSLTTQIDGTFTLEPVPEESGTIAVVTF